MSGSTKRIDARGQACPGPVIMTKKAFDEGGFESLEVLVDGPTAAENVSRFAAHEGHEVEGIADEDGASAIRIRPRGAAANAAPVVAAAPDAAARDSAAETLFISSAAIGSGSEELGELLMKGFIKTLLDAPSLPKRIIFMNGGVRLAVEGSASLESLRKLADLGVEVLACGTCLDYYQVKDKLAVGRVSNMFEISGFLLGGPSLSL
jgi:selenium metabolism protein YedF